MDKNTEYYYKSAQHYLLPVKLLKDMGAFLLQLGKKNYFFQVRLTPFNNVSNATMARNKYISNVILRDAGIPVPKASFIEWNDYQAEKLPSLIADMRFPLVAKPTFGGLGKNVFCNVQNISQLREYLNENLADEGCISIEEFHQGLKSYRILVFMGKVIGIIYREPSFVIGDGAHNIADLIVLTNEKRAAQDDALKPIEIDKECELCLEEQQLHLNSIPAAGEQVQLGYTCNASRGGLFSAVPTHTICKENRKMMTRIARLMSLDLVGIDVECEDIGTPIKNSPKNVVIEVNYSPSVRIHEKPLRGPANAVSRKIMRHFIFRHPFAYLKILYKHKKTAFYVRSFIFLIFLGIIYKLYTL